MSSRRSIRRPLVALLVGVLVGGGLMAVTPAGAEVSNAVATNWKKIWNKELKPQADQRYYTKKKSNKRYQPKGSYEAAGSGYSKAETYSKTETYSKAEVDAKLAPLVNSVAATASGDQALALPAGTTVVRSVSVMPPANGMVVVSASAQVQTTTAGLARCSISLGTTLDSDFYQVTGGDVGYSMTSGTRGIAVTKGSLLTANLVCDEFTGQHTIHDSAMTAIFAPS
ncbi:hypothetical protein AAII07_06620 [Microvirga sp. 0TCS3.31]